MVRFEALEKTALGRRVVEQLTDSVVRRDLPPGSLLPSERELTAQFGVSRTVIRESIQTLAALGLVDVRHGVGTLVNAPADWRLDEPLALLLRAERHSLLNWMEVRKVVEVGFAQLAATRRTPQDLEAIAAAINRMRANIEDPEACMAADRDFHFAVSGATANSMAPVLMRPMLRPLHEYLVEAVRLPGAVGDAIAAHEAIEAAIVGADPGGSAAAMEAHLAHVIAEIENLYGEGRAPLVELAMSSSADTDAGAGTASIANRRSRIRGDS